jgi:hypothetical protein
MLVRNSGRVGAEFITVILKQSVAELQQLVRPPACPRGGHVPERAPVSRPHSRLESFSLWRYATAGPPSAVAQDRPMPTS